MKSPWIRRIGIAVGVLLVLLVVGATVLVATFDANRYKGVAIDWMKTHRDRTLAIDGPIRLAVFPRVQITLSKVALSEPGRAERFASIDEAGLSLELWPLLRKRVVVDHVQAKGVSLRYHRDAKGVRNFDDLIEPPASAPAGGAAPSPPAPPGAPAMQFDVSSISLEDVRVSVRDEMARLAGDATLKSLSTGRLANRASSPISLDASVAFSQPKVQGTLSGRTMLALDLEADSVRLSDTALVWKGDLHDLRGVDATIDGSLSWDGRALGATNLAFVIGATVGELKLAASTLKVRSFRFDPQQQRLELEALKLNLAGEQAGNPIKAALDWPQLEASAKALKGSALNGTFSIAGDHKLDGTFRSGAPAGSFDELKLPGLAFDASGKIGPRTVKALLRSDLTLRGNQRAVALDALALQANLNEPGLQPLALAARGQATASAEKAAWALTGAVNDNQFGIDGHANLGGPLPFVKAQAKFDALDLNRLLSPAKPGPAPQPTGPAAADTPVALDGLQKLNGQFGFSAGRLAFQQYRVSDARVDASLDGGVLRIGKLAGKAWGGTVDGSGSADAKARRIAFKVAASGVDVNALLQTVAGKDLLEGTGRVSADLASTGRTVGELRSRLSGTASLQVRDGAIKGYNLARGLRQAKAALSLKQDAVSQASRTEKTDFSELSASARIADGVAHSDDLDMKSPFLRVSGSGRFDIGRGRIDYVARATVADTSKGQGGAELAALRGVTVPVQLSGPFEAIDWKIQWSGVAAEAIENRLKDKLGEKLGLKPAEGGASAPSSAETVKEKLKDQLLKGLFK